MADGKRTIAQIATDPLLSTQQKVDEIVSAQVDDHLGALLNSCWHCGRSLAEHANRQCLFASTYYQHYGLTLKAATDHYLATHDDKGRPKP